MKILILSRHGKEILKQNSFSENENINFLLYAHQVNIQEFICTNGEIKREISDTCREQMDDMTKNLK